MKNETKQNDPQVIKQKLSTRNTRPQEESQGINSAARRRPLVVPVTNKLSNRQANLIWNEYHQEELRLGDSHLQIDWI